MNGKPTPRRFAETELAKVGVEVVNPYQSHLKCKICGMEWLSPLKHHGRRPAGYWKCPNGCNG
jgi:hypothetical protein